MHTEIKKLRKEPEVLFTFTATTKPECERFLKIRIADGEFQTINCFIRDHPNATENFLNTCILSYRGRELSYNGCEDEYTAFSEQMKFVELQALVDAHAAIFQSITETIADIDYETML